MKILVVSDTHNKHENLFKIFEQETFDAVIFLGDVEAGEDIVREALEKKAPLCPIKFLKGNCDNFKDFDISAVITYEGVSFFAAHGHTFHVNFGREYLAREAREEDCRYALFGHLHLPIIEEVEGVVCFNPGSVSEPRDEEHRASYGVIDIEDGDVILEHRFVDELGEE